MGSRKIKKAAPALAGSDLLASSRVGELDACSDTSSFDCQQDKLLAARDRLDHGTELMNWALDFSAIIDMHGAWLDIQLMRDEAAAYRRAVAKGSE